MKLFTLFIAACLLLIGCSQEQTSQQKAETAIKHHLTAKLGKESGYQSVETKLDSFYVGYAQTKEGGNLQKEYNAVRAENKDIYSPNALLLASKEMVLLDTLNARSKRFGQVFYGWKAIHAYKAKNKLGTSELITDTFLLNKDYQLMQADTISTANL